MYKELNDGNHRSLLDYVILVFFMLIIYSNVTIIGPYKIIMFPVLLLLLVIHTLLHNKIVYINYIDKLWYLVFSYLVFLLPFSYDLKESMIFISYFVIIILIMSLLKSKKHVQQELMKIFYVVALLYSIITLSTFFYRDLIIKYFSFLFDNDRIFMIKKEISRGAFSGLAGEVSYNMFTISMGLGVVISNIIVKKKLSIFNIILIIIMSTSLLLTQKRSVIVVLFLILILMIRALKNDKKTIKKIRKLIFMLILIGIILVIIEPEIVKVFNRFFVDGELYLSQRDILWNYAIQMFYNKPLFGYGINTYNIYCNDRGYFIGARHAHNIYLQLLAETGIVGFAIFMTAFFVSLIETVKTIRNTIKLPDNLTLKVAAVFSLYVQLFFLLYGIVGLPLYNFTQLLVYLTAVSIGQYVKMEISFERGSLQSEIV